MASLSPLQVVVCIVVDGRKVFNPRTRAMLAALGVYQEGVAKNVVNGKPVVSVDIALASRSRC
jgi:chitin synthase